MDELIKLANQSNKQARGALVIEAANITTILIFHSKKLAGRSKHYRNKRRSKECYVLIKKDISKVKTHCCNRFCRKS